MPNVQGPHRVVELPPACRHTHNYLDLSWWKHSIYGLLEVDVTVARRTIEEHRVRTGEALSFTGWGLTPAGQSLLLIVGGIARKRAVVEDRIEPRDLLNLTAAFDHDVVDGAPTARVTTQAPRTKPRRGSVPLYFVLAFALSWSAWLTAALVGDRSPAGPDASTVLILVGSFGPLFAALITTALFDGRSGFRELGRRLLTWRVRPSWYAFVLLWPALLSLATTGVSIALGGHSPSFDHPPLLDSYPLPPDLTKAVPWLAFMPVVFLQQLLFGSSMGEEPGWRGYALPRMQWAHGALPASLMLGLLWGIWHLPLWVWRDQRPVLDVGWELVGILAATVLFTWVFNHTGGSLLLAMLFHASIAVTGLFLAEAHLSPAIEVVLAWLTIALVSVLDRQAWVSN